jgi:antitoxin FitA
MTSITLQLTDEQLSEQKERAMRAGISVEELASARLQDWLRQSPSDFAASAERVLTKNAELYKRLA